MGTEDTRAAYSNGADLAYLMSIIEDVSVGEVRCGLGRHRAVTRYGTLRCDLHRIYSRVVDTFWVCLKVLLERFNGERKALPGSEWRSPRIQD